MAETGFYPGVEQTGDLKSATAADTVKIVKELCAQLISQGGGFHGNIWPGSVTFDEEGHAVLAEGSDAPVSERDPGQVEYLAPEFFWNSSVSPAADVYSLGIMLYAGCNNGYLPFQPKGGALTERDRSAALRKRMKGESIKLPSGIGRDMRNVLRKALAYDPEKRYASPAELLAALDGTEAALPVGEAEDSAAPEYTEPAADFVKEEAPLEGSAAAEDADKRYTVQKDFESEPGRRKTKSEASAVPAANRKKKRSPAIAALCVIAAAAIAGGVYWGVNQSRSRQVSEPFETAEAAEESSEPVVIRTTDTPAATNAPHTLQLLPPAEQASAKPAATAAPEEPAVTGSSTVDGMDVEPLSDTVYVSGYGVNLRSGPGTSYDVAANLIRGTKLQRTGTVNGWSQVQYEGEEYYISDSLIQEEDPFAGLAESMEENTAGTAGAGAAVTSPAPTQGTTGTAGAGTTGTGAAGTNSTTNTTGTTNSTGTGTTASSSSAQTTSSASAPSTSSTSSSSSSTSSSSGAGSWSQSSSSSSVATTTLEMITVSSEANLRSGPGTGYSVVSTVPAGTTLQRTGISGDWSRVVYGGQELYISNSLIRGGTASDGTTDAIGTLRVTSDVNVRSGPGTNYSILDVARVGANLSVTGVADGGKWYRVSYNGNTGYVNRNLVSVQSLTIINSASGTARVISDVNIRSGPGTGYEILGVARAGDSLTVTGYTDSNWYRVTSSGGRTGFVAGNYVNASGTNVKPSNSTPAPTSAPATSTGWALSDANIRSGPGTGYSILGTVSRGASLSITGSENGWYRVSYNGKTGYIASNLVTRNGAPDPAPSTTTGWALYDANIRSGPVTSYSIIGDVVKGDSMTILGTENGWYKVTHYGTTGYIASNLVTKDGAPSSTTTGWALYDANIRSGPGTSYSIIGDVVKGDSMTILSTENGWYKVTHYGTTGYIASNLVTKDGKPDPAPSTTTGWALYDANIRSGPGTDYSIIGDVARGDSVSITGTENGWYRLNFNGKTGYIASNLVTKDGKPDPAPSTTTGWALYDSNIRSGPGTDYSVVGDVVKGDSLTILGSENGWYKVTHYGTTGYISANLVTTSGAPAPSTSSSTSTRTGYALYDSNIRSGPGTDYSIIGDVVKGDSLSVGEYVDGWYRLNFNGKTGYIAANLVEF